MRPSQHPADLAPAHPDTPTCSFDGADSNGDGGSDGNVIGGDSWNDNTAPNDGPPTPADVTYLDCGQGAFADPSGMYCSNW